MSDSDNIDEQNRSGRSDWVGTPSDEPQGRLTQLCADMMKVLETPENEDVKAIVMLEEVRDDHSYNGLAIVGYEDTAESLAAMYMHVRAAFKAHGFNLNLITEDGALT